MNFLGLCTKYPDLPPFVVSVASTPEQAVDFAEIRLGRKPDLVVNAEVASWRALPVEAVSGMLRYTFGCYATTDEYPEENILSVAALFFQFFPTQHSPVDRIDNCGSKAGTMFRGYSHLPPVPPEVTKELEYLLASTPQTRFSITMRRYFSEMLLSKHDERSLKTPADWRGFTSKIRSMCKDAGIEWDIKAYTREREIFRLKKQSIVSYVAKQWTKGRSVPLKDFPIWKRNGILRNRHPSYTTLKDKVFDHIDDWLLTNLTLPSKEECVAHLCVYEQANIVRRGYDRYQIFYGMKERNDESNDAGILETDENEGNDFSED